MEIHAHEVEELVAGGDGHAIAAWLRAHPACAQELAASRRVHQLLMRMRPAELPVPLGFEERVLARVFAERAADRTPPKPAGGVRALVERVRELRRRGE